MRKEINDRLLALCVLILHLEKPLRKTYSSRHVYNQLFRAATSAGANYAEASGAESRQDFIHKMQIALKELRESFFWLRLIINSGIILNDCDIINSVLKENEELLRMIGKSVVTAKKNAMA